MGMSGRGEIERMSRAAQPDIAVIANIGTSHMEMLGSRECIRDAKMEIALGLRKGGYLLLNKDEPLLRGAVGKSYRTLYVSLSCEEADFFAQNIRMENGCTYFDACWREGRLENLSLSLMGRHNVYAALYALAVGLLLDVPKDAIRRGLRAYTPEGMRQNLYRHGGITLIEDCYNASPESMRAALDVLQAAATGRRIAVLGDMLELGVTSATLHKEVGAYLAALRVERLFTVGEGGSLIAEGAVSAGMSRDCIFECPQKEDIDALCKALGSCLSFGDTVLVKASRGVKLERVIDYLKKNDQDIL